MSKEPGAAPGVAGRGSWASSGGVWALAEAVHAVPLFTALNLWGVFPPCEAGSLVPAEI